MNKPALKKLRADATGFEGELAESQYALVDGEIEKVPLIVLHGVVAFYILGKYKVVAERRVIVPLYRKMLCVAILPASLEVSEMIRNSRIAKVETESENE